MKSLDFSSLDDEEKDILRDLRISKKHPYGKYTYYHRKLSFARKLVLFLLILLPFSLGFYLVYRGVFSEDSAFLLFIAGQLIILFLFFGIFKGAKQIALDEREIVIGDFKASRIVTVYFFIFPAVVFIGLLFQQVPFGALLIAGAAVAIGYYIHFVAGKKYFSTDKDGNITIKKTSGYSKFNIRILREIRLYNLPRKFKNIHIPKKIVLVSANGREETIPLGGIRSLRLRIFIPPKFIEAYFYRQALLAGFKVQPMPGNLTGRNGWVARSAIADLPQYHEIVLQR